MVERPGEKSRGLRRDVSNRYVDTLGFEFSCAAAQLGVEHLAVRGGCGPLEQPGPDHLVEGDGVLVRRVSDGHSVEILQ
jgi:hypothetical protein